MFFFEKKNQKTFGHCHTFVATGVLYRSEVLPSWLNLMGTVLPVPLNVSDGLQPPAARTSPSIKQLGRSVFYRLTRLALNAPGGRLASRLIFKLAPAPIDWLARRYRAYDGRHDADVRAAPSPLVAFPAGAPELSEAEGRLYRQFASIVPPKAPANNDLG